MPEHQLQNSIASEQHRDDRELEAVLWRTVDESPVVGVGPHIWVGTVNDYLAGAPWGRWIVAAQPVKAVQREIDTMVQRAPSASAHGDGGRWHVFSHSGFGRYEPTADTSLREIVRRAELYREEGRAFAAWAWLGGDDPAWLARFFDAYQGRFEHVEDWLITEVERAGYDRMLDQVVPETLRPHVEINVASLAHELCTSGAVRTMTDPERPGVFVFRLE